MMTIGIYSIRHKQSGKRYVGKSVNVERRLITHKYYCSRNVPNKRHSNRHLYNAIRKYGWDAFDKELLETFDTVDNKLISERELFWIDFYDATNRDKGYNLRRDSSTGLIVHDETKKMMSENMKGSNNPNFGNNWTDTMKTNMSIVAKERHKSGLFYGNGWKEKQRDITKQRWINDRNSMLKYVDDNRHKIMKYRFIQMTKDGGIVRVWESVRDIIDENPTYKRHNIYAACSGEKPSIYGFIWKKELL